MINILDLEKNSELNLGYREFGLKIALIMNDITIFGGVERVVANLSNEFIKCHDVCVISLYSTNNNIQFHYSDKVRIIKLFKFQKIYLKSTKNPLFKILREISRPFVRMINKIIDKGHIKRVKNSIKNLKPDIIIDNTYDFINGGFFGNDQCIIKIIHAHFDWYKKLDLNGFSNLVLLSSQEIDRYKEIYPKANFCVIPNFIPNIPNLNTNYSQKVVLSMGRIEKTNQKGFLRLIDIWKLIQDSSEFKDWKLHIVGDGELKEQIKTKIDNLNLSNSIILKPFTKDVESEYLSASIYAMTSHFEGLPMVLIEAGTYALPTIAFDIATGPSDIIEDEKSGFLIEDNNLNEYVNKLKALMKDESLRAKMGEKSKEIVKNKFSKEVVMKQWMELFKGLKK